eukprot:3266-Heterococcus_DN1.PRE.1
MIRLKKKAEAEETAEAARKEAIANGETPADEDEDMAEGSSSAAAAGGSSSTGVKLLGIGGKRTKKTGKAAPRKTPGEIRIQKDIAELDGGTVAVITFPNPNNLCNFQVVVTPDSGLWKGASYDFSFTVPGHYPHDPPKVICNTKSELLWQLYLLSFVRSGRHPLLVLSAHALTQKSCSISSSSGLEMRQ